MICSKHAALDEGRQTCLLHTSHLEEEIVDIQRLCAMLVVPQVAAFLYPVDNNFVTSRCQSLLRLKEKIDPL